VSFDGEKFSMKRTKEWWSKFSSEDKWFIWHFEREQNNYGHMGGYLPDDCSECVVCGDPMFSSGVCTHCLNRYTKLIDG
jgi:hypothetical protein